MTTTGARDISLARTTLGRRRHPNVDEPSLRLARLARRARRSARRIRAAAKALLVEGVLFAVGLRCGPTPRANGSPVAALEHARPFAGDRGGRPFVDVTR